MVICDIFKRNKDKNEICKCCDRLAVNQLAIFTVSLNKFSGGGITGAKKDYSLFVMVSSTLQYVQGHYYFSNLVKEPV